MTTHGRIQVALTTLLGLAVPAAAENIDPANNASQYAWAENVGWINAEPSGNGGVGVQVDDFELTGWMWAENIGWISLSCKNTSSCAAVSYGVRNDGHGVLSGYAWGENVGWINFAPATAGVSIDPSTGDFSGRGWGENIGWITFASSGANPYKVTSSWTCGSPPAPTGSPELRLEKLGSDTELSWSAVDGTGFDVPWGDLGALRAMQSFSTAVQGCLGNNSAFTAATHSATPTSGNGYWYLVRPVNCGGSGSYGTTKRDQEIPSSPNACP
jgi:hypothetical protein